MPTWRPREKNTREGSNCPEFEVTLWGETHENEEDTWGKKDESRNSVTIHESTEQQGEGEVKPQWEDERKEQFQRTKGRDAMESVSSRPSSVG